MGQRGLCRVCTDKLLFLKLVEGKGNRGWYKETSGSPKAN
jgi:hypothetical protein